MKPYLYLLSILFAFTCCDGRISNQSHPSKQKTNTRITESDSLDVLKTIKDRWKEYEESTFHSDKKYSRGDKVVLFEDLDFDKGEWRMVFHPALVYFGELQSIAKYQYIEKSVLEKALLENANGISSYTHFYDAGRQKYLYPCRELKDEKIMREMKEKFILTFKPGMPGSQPNRLLVFRNDTLVFRASLHSYDFEDGIYSAKGYSHTAKPGILYEYMSKFKPVDYDLKEMTTLSKNKAHEFIRGTQPPKDKISRRLGH